MEENEKPENVSGAAGPSPVWGKVFERVQIEKRARQVLLVNGVYPTDREMILIRAIIAALTP